MTDFDKRVQAGIEARLTKRYEGRIEFSEGDERIAFKGVWTTPDGRTTPFEIVRRAYQTLGPSPARIAEDVEPYIIELVNQTGPTYRRPS